MIDDLYSSRILALAANMPRAGRLADPEGSAEKTAKLCGSTILVDVTLDAAGKEIYFCHWAGLQSLPAKLAFDDAWRVFSEAAWAKVGR